MGAFGCQTDFTLTYCRSRDGPSIHCDSIDAVFRHTNLASLFKKSPEKTIRQPLKRYLTARCCTKRAESYRQLLSSLVSVTASLFFFVDIKVCCGHAVM